MSRFDLFERLSCILRRFVRTADRDLTDDEFVRAVFRRYDASREDYLLDPGE